MAAMLGNSSSVVVVVVRTRPREIPLAMITMRKSTHGFPFLSHDEYGAPLGGPLGRRPQLSLLNMKLVAVAAFALPHIFNNYPAKSRGISSDT